MKHILKKLILALTACLLSGAMVSCGNLSDGAEENQQEKARLFISLGENSARSATLLPSDVSEDDISKAELTVLSGTDSENRSLAVWQTTSAATALAQMKADESLLIDAGTYTFTLSLYTRLDENDVLCQKGSITKSVVAGNNTLDFSTDYVDESTGNLSLSLNFKKTDWIEKICVGIKTADGTTVQESESIYSYSRENASDELTAAYAKTGLPSGEYVLTFAVYGLTPYAREAEPLVNTFQKLVKIASGCVTRAEITLSDINTIYSVSFVLPAEAEGPSDFYRNKAEGCILPSEVTYAGHTFLGWYDNENFEGEKLVSLEAGTSGDITLYASFCDGIIISADEIPSLKEKLTAAKDAGLKSITVKITDMDDAKEPEDWESLFKIEGEIGSAEILSKYIDERFAVIFDAICSVQGDINTDGFDENDRYRVFTYSGLGVNLDLSGTSLTYMPFGAFCGTKGLLNNNEAKLPVNLTGITFPESLTALLPQTFWGAGFTEVEIPKNVNFMRIPFLYTQGISIIFEEGSRLEKLYSLTTEMDMKSIVIPKSVRIIEEVAFYSSSLESISFEEGSSLESIGESAFYGTDIESIVLPASLKEIKDYAFEELHSLENITFLGTTAQWAAVERGEAWHEGITATAVACSDGLVGLDYPIGTKLPSEPKAVGDIVFTDGSATPYSADLTLTDAQKAAAIALIFYKGTGLNSGDDTTTSRTLGVGLKHYTNGLAGLAWCLNSATAYSKNITTIQCPASGDAGALTFTGDRNGSDNLEQIEAFDGVDDTATTENYPAFYFAKNYSDTATNIAGTDYESGWYLPSIAELFQIYSNGKGENKVFDIDAASEALGGDKFGTSCYWSSSQYASYDDMSYQLSFYDEGLAVYYYKDYNLASCVCAVRAFN